VNLFKPSHIIFLLIVVILLFGYKKLPDIARSVGQSMKVFKKEVKELRDEPTQSGQTAQSAEGSSQK